MTKCPFRPANLMNALTDFGANNVTGDGVTDDLTKMNAAIASCTAGQTYYLPTGTYLCNGVVVGKEGVHMRGVGEGSWLKGSVAPASHTNFNNLKMGRDGAYHWGSSASATDIHNVNVNYCSFVGGEAGGEAPVRLGNQRTVHDVQFLHCTFYASSEVENNVSISAYCTSTSQVYNILFQYCDFPESRRMAFECVSYNVSGSIYPVHDVDILDCTIGACDSTAISYAFNAMEGGAQESGDCRVWDNTIADAGVTAPASGKWGIELQTCVGMSVKRNTVSGSYVQSMLNESNEDGPAQAYNNTIEDNVFDGTNSALSAIKITPSVGCTYTGNTIKTRNGCVIQDGDSGAFSGNDIWRVNSDGSLSTTGYGTILYRCTDVTFTGDTFRSRYSTVVYLGTTGSDHSTGIVFDTCTFQKDAGDTAVAKHSSCATCSFTETDSTYIT